MADTDRNLTLEELQAKKEVLKVRAKELGATDAEITALSREPASKTSMPTATDYLTSALDNTPPGTSDSYVSARSMDVTALEAGQGSDASPDDLYKQTFDSLSGNFVDSVVDAHLQSFSNKVSASMEQFIQELGEDDSQLITQEDLQTPATDLYVGTMGMQQALADIYYKESLASKDKRSLETQGYYASLLERQAEDRNVWDKISDGVGLIFDPVLYSFDLGDLAALDPTAKGSTDIEKVVSIVGGFQALDPDVQASVAPTLIERIWEASGNNEFKAAAMNALLFDPDYRTTIGVDVALDSSVVLAPLVSGFALIKQVKKMHTMTSKLKGMGSTQDAVKVVTDRVSQHKKAMDADAMDWENHLVGADLADDGLAVEYSKIADRIKEDIVEPMRQLNRDDAVIKLDALTPDEKNLYIQSKLDALNEANDKVVRNAQLVSRDDNGFKISYQVDLSDGKGDVIRTMDLKWTKDAAGYLNGIDNDLSKSLSAAYGHKLLSPETVLRTLDNAIVSDATFGGMQASVVRNSLTKLWKETEKSLMNIPVISFKGGKLTLARGDARKAVDELLISGDEAGEVWTMDDLLNGNVQTMSGMRKYTPEEAQAYFAKRAFLDEAHSFQNKLVRDKLDFLGMKHVKWVDSKGQEVSDIGKVVKDTRGIPEDAAILRTDSDDLTNIANVRASIAAEDASLDPTQTVVRFLKPKEIDGKRVQYGLVNISEDTGRISNLPKNVLNRVKGYVPRISKPGYVYVKNAKTGETLARFKNMDNATAWAAKTADRMNAERVAGEGVEQINLVPFRDRDFSAIDAVVEDANTYGGLFTGSRSKDGIFAGDDLIGETTRLSAGQSINRMVDNISFQMPMNEYRLAMMQRWKNTAKRLLANDGIPADSPVMRAIDSDSEWHKADLSNIKDLATKNLLETHREYLIDALKVAHKDERTFSNMLMRIADRPFANNKFADKIGLRDKIISVASNDPIQALKGATFDAYLGWFNPRQLYVQAQNAALALSMHPVKGLKAIPEALVQRAFLFTPTIEKSIFKQAAKGLFKDDQHLQDMIESVEQFKRSGLRDGVMRTGDYASNLGGFSNGAIDSYRKWAGAGRVFFEEGESMARMISWNIARRNWKEANPGKAIDDDAIKAISKDTLRMNMNMQRENAAWWQKNAFTAIPTQFLQVQAKLAENIFGSFTGKGAWSKKEAAGVLAGQVFLYGMGGFAVSEGLSNAAKEGWSGSGMQFAIDNPTLNQMVDRGVTGVLLNTLGIENNFSDSGSILAGMDDNVVFDVVTNFIDMLEGNANSIEFKAPSMGVLQRGTDALGSVYQAIVDVSVAPTLETLGDSVLNSISEFAAISSTWSNARKAWWLHRLGEIRSKNGTLIAAAEQTDGLNLQTILAKAMGFTTDLEDAYYRGNAWKMDRSQMTKDTSKAINQMYDTYRKDGNLEKMQGTFALIMSEYENRPDLARSIINRTLKNIANPKSSIEKLNKSFLTDLIKSGGQMTPRSFQQPLFEKPVEAEE